MKARRGIIILLAIVAVTIPVLTCLGEEKQTKEKENIWKDEGPGGPRMGPGLEHGPGPGRFEMNEPRGPRFGPGRFELTDEEIGRIMKDLAKSNPEKAKELEKMRKEDPQRFQMELRRYGGEEFGRMIRERMEKWGRQMQTEFIEWLEKNYHQESQELANIKDKDPELYNKKLDLIREKYWRIFEEEKRNPELAGVLKEDLELKKNRDELIGRIKSAKNDEEKKALTAQLEEIVSRRFDLIVRRKQLVYEELLKRIEELQKQVKESREEINKWKDEKFKDENVKKHVKDLIEGDTQFRWD